MGGAVFITGGAKRIGCAIAKAFAAEGYALALHYNTAKEEAQRLAKDLPTKTHTLQADLSTLTLAQAHTLLVEAENKLGTPITCLVNNASLFERDDGGDINENLLDAHFALNLKAPLFLSQALLRQNENKKIHRHIIMLLDQTVLRPTPAYFSYSLSKGALWNATQMLARAYAPQVRVNGIGPGPILPHTGQTQNDFDKSVARTALQKSATPEDIAATCLFLEQQTAVTGQMLALDGGQHLGR